jgi:putative CocE/NonD family hydrolase
MRAPLLIALIVCVRAWAQPASMAGFSDEGAFILYANEEQLARVAFQWKPDGSFESKGVLSLAGQSVTGTLTITPDADGRWTKVVVDYPSHKITWEREGKTFHVTFPDRKGNGAWPEDALTFESWTPPLISLALRRFDAAGESRQTLPVLVLDLKLFEANLQLERQNTVERAVGGRNLKLTRWIYAPFGHEYQVLADQDGRVFRVSGVTGFDGVSEQNGVFVREGYEGLRDEPRANGPGSQPKFEVENKPGVRVAMRDGVQLSTDLYLPAGATKSPVILVRTPYKKELELLVGRYFARRGYVVAAQDVRGRFGSPGQWEPFIHEAQDGYDTIEWLARQPWSDGKIGMIGASYLGWAQWWAASLHPPHLVTMIPNVSPPDPFHNIPFDSGALLLRGAIGWADLVESNATGDISGAARKASSGKNYVDLLKALPVIDLDKAVMGKEAAYWRRWMAHPFPDTYWSSAMFQDKLKQVNLPVFHQSGWFDGDGIGSKLNYLAMRGYGHPNQKLTIGPWEHSDTATRISMERDFGSAAAVDLQGDYLRWFDHWLKGIDNGMEREPLVSLFIMGSNRWLHGPVYPLPETRFEKLYLSAGRKLSFQAPDGSQAPDHYTYDPADPTPEDRPAKDRKDILVYTAPPFEKPYTIAGPLSAVIYAATSARDTDWFVHVTEIDAEGKSSYLWANNSEGHIRARYRNSLTRPELLTPGRVYKYTIDLWHTGVTIAPGHRLRVEVSSAAFPMFDRNLNTGGNNETEVRFLSANQSIYHDQQHESYVLLPRIPE